MSHPLSRRATRAVEARSTLKQRQVDHHRPDRQAPPQSPTPDDRAAGRAREGLQSVIGR